MKKIDMRHFKIQKRKNCIRTKGEGKELQCDSESVSGVVSQRACVYCGARVVLNPITDAVHIVHGPIGCASYTCDIRGSLTSDKDLYRNSFSTDLGEQDIVFGGEKKLIKCIDDAIVTYNPEVIFVYATCIIGVIGDDVEKICKIAESKYGRKIIPVMAHGFAGRKSMGYKLACDAIMQLISKDANIIKSKENRKSVNILGDFNLAGEIWIVKNYLKQMSLEVFGQLTGDSNYRSLMKSPEAALNIVQCAGSSMYLAKRMKQEFNIPFLKVSFFGITDTTESLCNIANFIGDSDIIEHTKRFCAEKSEIAEKEITKYMTVLKGKKAAIYVGGGFKAISLIKQFREIGMETVIVGTQTGGKEDYEEIEQLVNEGCIILDDANPYELEHFIKLKNVDILVGGVKERALAYKMGIAFCDHNHERKLPLAGYEGAVNFVKELNVTINSAVWKAVKDYNSEFEIN